MEGFFVLLFCFLFVNVLILKWKNMICFCCWNLSCWYDGNGMMGSGGGRGEVKFIIIMVVVDINKRVNSFEWLYRFNEFFFIVVF